MEFDVKWERMFTDSVVQYYKHQKDAYIEEYLEKKAEEAGYDRQASDHKINKYLSYGKMQGIVEMVEAYQITEHMILKEIVEIKKQEHFFDALMERGVKKEDEMIAKRMKEIEEEKQKQQQE